MIGYDNPMIAMPYDKYFIANNEVFIGYIKNKTDDFYELDIIKNNKKLYKVNIRDVKYISNRYLVLQLWEIEKSDKEVFDTLTSKLLSEQILDTKISLLEFNSGDAEVPMAICMDNNFKLTRFIVTDKFDCIKTPYLWIDNSTITEDNYIFDGLVDLENLIWERVKMNKYTGEILENKLWQYNMGTNTV